MNPQIALVTGGSKGLGRAIVEGLCDKGCIVYFTFLKDTTAANALKETYPKNAFPLQSDASDPNEAALIVEKIEAVHGQIDFLVNNVYGAKDHALLNHNMEDFDYTLKHTLYPSFYFTHAVAKGMTQAKKGRIVTIGSINGLRGRQGSLAYSTAKSALVGFSKTVAKELGAFGITSNLIAPGYIATDGQVNTSELIKKMVLDESAIRKLPRPHEVAKLVLYLLLEDEMNITGEVFKIDCGQYI